MKVRIGLGIAVFSAFLIIGFRVLSFRSSAPMAQPGADSAGTLASSDQPKPAPGIDRCADIYRLICHKRGIIRDPTGAVRTDLEGEKQALRIYEEIIHTHRDWNSEQIDEELVKRIFNPKQRARLISAYGWVQNTILKIISDQPNAVFTSREKRLIKTRIRKTQLQLPPPASVYADEPDLLTKNDVYYQRMDDDHLRLRVGGAYLFVAKSWFNLVFTFAHELGHAIDPCEFRAAGLSFPAYDQLHSCFLKTKVITTPKNRSECGNNDQLSEAFADWLAVQVTAKALASFSREFPGPQLMNAATNAVRDLCEQEDEEAGAETHFHPSPQTRIKEIFGNNPQIRELLGCKSEVTPQPYCTFEREP